MWELDHKKGWALKNLCFQTVVLEKTLESPLKSEEIKPVNPKGNQTWIFIGRTDAEAEEPTFWPPDVKSQLMSKDPDSGKDWAKKRSRWQRIRWLYGIASLMDMTLRKLWWRTGKPGVQQTMGSQRVRLGWMTEQQQQQVSMLSKSSVPYKVENLNWMGSF